MLQQIYTPQCDVINIEYVDHLYIHQPNHVKINLLNATFALSFYCLSSETGNYSPYMVRPSNKTSVF